MAKKRDKKEQEKKKKKNGRMPCCEKEGIRRGAWTAQEDKILTNFITQNGHGTWRNLPKLAGLPRCGKSCRLRWTNYLRPDIKRGPFTPDEENSIVHLHQTLGNKWSAIASHLPGRTDNDVKNFWNSHLRKRLSCKVQNQTPSSSMSDYTKCEYPLTAQTVNTESHINTPSGSKGEGDYFLRLWNCEVGQSFRNNNEIEWDAAVSHSPASQTSYFTNIVEPFKADQNVEFLDCKKESENVGVYSDSSKSCDLDDSSEAMLELLLDFPAGTDDIEFVQGPVDDVSTDIRG